MSAHVCPTCETPQRKFYCTDCLRAHLQHFRNATERVAVERETEVEKAKKALAGIDKRRVARADLARLENSIRDLKEAAQGRLTQNEDLRNKIVRAKDNLRRRRDNITAARSMANAERAALPGPPVTKGVSSESSQRSVDLLVKTLSQTHTSLARTRRVLIRELVQVFDVKEVSTPSPSSPNAFASPFPTVPFGVGSVLGTFSRKRPSQQPIPISSHSYHPAFNASRPSASSPNSPNLASYAIATLHLPHNPADIQRLPPEHIQAVMQYLLQFIRLLTFYMGVKLPFDVVWDGGPGLNEGVGRPWIRASRGSDDGGWAKFSAAQPLHPPTPSSSSSSANVSPESSIHPSLAQSIIHPSSSSYDDQLVPSFTTALAMLNFNVAYLLYTQGLTIPVTSATSPLRNLVAMCFSPLDSVGHMSHDTLYQPCRLPSPTGGKVANGVGGARERFAVDFGELLKLQQTVMGTRKEGKKKVMGDDDWDLIEVDEEQDGQHKIEKGNDGKRVAETKSRPPDRVKKKR